VNGHEQPTQKGLKVKKIVPVVRLAIRSGMTKLKITLWIKFNKYIIYFFIYCVKQYGYLFLFFIDGNTENDYI